MVLGHGMSSCRRDNQGSADVVYVVDDPLLQDFLPRPYTSALTKLAKEAKPKIVLAAALRKAERLCRLLQRDWMQD